MVHFRKRFSLEALQEINEIICLDQNDKKDDSDDFDDEKENSGNLSSKKEEDSDCQSPQAMTPNKGKLLMDATCIPADMTYPTDMKLLNKAREKTEQIIDLLSKNLPEKKVRTNR